MTQQAEVPFGSAQSFIAHYVMQRRAQFGILLCTAAGAAACAIAMQYQMKQVVDAMTHVAASPAIWIPLFCFIALTGLESLLWRLCAIMSCRTTIGAGVQIRLDLFAHLSGQSMRYFADNLAGSLGQRITGTAGNFGALANTVMWRVVPPIVDFAGALLIFSLISWPMAAVLGVFVGLATGLLILAGRNGRLVHTEYFAHASRTAGSIIDVISNMWAVKAFSARRRERDRLATEFQSEADAQRNSWMYSEKTRIYYDLALWAMSSSMALWSIRSWSAQAITAGDVVIIIALTFRILHGSREVALALVDVSQQIGFIDDTLKAFGSIHPIADSRAATDRAPGPGDVEFRAVSFGYDRARPILRNVSVKIAAGQKVGIVGPSGAGKTTIVQLLQRLHEVQRGEILINHIPLHDFTQDSLRSMLSVVPQEISLFHRTVMENIRFARPGATDSDVYTAARAARCDDFVRRLPHGYHTTVGERGIKLSGGQRQRIGIARALLKDAPILILDEATSALDTASEQAIQRAIAALPRDRTVLAVAHRLSTIAAFDRVLVIDDGRIIEDGPPRELQRHGKFFRSMWRLQSQGMEEYTTENFG